MRVLSPMNLNNFIALLCLSTIACSNQDTSPYYNNQHILEEDIAVFARVGAGLDEFESATNHFRIHKSLEAINFDDLGVNISPCEQEGTLFCLSGFLPIILPEFTGAYEYEINGELIKAELIAPEGRMRIGNSARPICNVSISKLIVTKQDKIYEYILSKSHGIIMITQPTTVEPNLWYLTDGRLINLEAIC